MKPGAMDPAATNAPPKKDKKKSSFKKFGESLMSVVNKPSKSSKHRKNSSISTCTNFNSQPQLYDHEERMKRTASLGTYDGMHLSVHDPNNNRQPLDGQLLKYTNVVKGFQPRWFGLDPESGRLDYFEKEEHKKQRPRGSVYLGGAVISPSDEDSQTFTVNAANGENFRLRAFDAKERQHWVNRLRATAEYHTATIAQKNPPLPKDTRPLSLLSPNQHLKQNGSQSQDSLQNSAAPGRSPSNSLPDYFKSKSLSFKIPKKVGSPRRKKKQSTQQQEEPQQDKNSTVVIVSTRSSHKQTSSQTPECFKNAKEMLSQVQNQQSTLVHRIEELPQAGEQINSLDKEMLMLKATSNATLACLENCLSILHQQQASSSTSLLPSGATVEWLLPRDSSSMSGSTRSLTAPVSPAESFVSVASVPACDSSKSAESVPIDHTEDVEDESEYTDTDLGEVEEHKSIILHLLSQLKLGMDLTKVVLPTFILEKRSLLEMFADCMAHPDVFLQIPDLQSPEARMLKVVEWYLTSFHVSRKGSIAKKPYNPIIGETFHCSWQVPSQSQTQNSSADITSQSGSSELGQSEEGHDKTSMYYCAEQVSHHPPISAFYFECPEKKVCMNASIWTRSKFMGMSIGVVMIGKIRLMLLEHDEEYEFSLPSAYARSILTVPWVELGDRIVLSCPKSGYSASVTFHTKPFYGGKLHKTTSEVKNPAGEVVCKVAGEWNGALEFTYANGDTKVIDTTTLPSIRKRVRPLHKQGGFESRRLWQNVTEALKKNNIDTATQHKHYLEERQRQGERMRKENNMPFPTKYFYKEGETWISNKLLRTGQSETTA